jgi:SAM-dependent methyltransferase
VIVDANRAWYERPSQVRTFTAVKHLEAPEAWLLEHVEASLPELDVLDLGVGAGRTTYHFGPSARAYVGVDYSAPLVAVARGRFADQAHISFLAADARRLAGLGDATFDLVLFSVNGIDCVDNQGRAAALSEVARVLRPGGLFFFSSHNLEAVRAALSVRRFVADLAVERSPARMPAALIRRLPAHLLKRVANPRAARLAGQDWVWISKLWPPREPQMTYYVTPTHARRQLEHVGLELLDVVLPSGRSVGIDGACGRTEDLWLNYLARRRPDGASARHG